MQRRDKRYSTLHRIAAFEHIVDYTLRL